MATLPQALASVPTIFAACKPKEDVLQGTMADAEFAADLAQVLRGTAPPQYANPNRFFSNTYPTRGLKDLLLNVCGRLSKGQGVASIFRLDTSYGGGKTHGLIALVLAVRSGRAVPNIAEFVDQALLPTGNVRIAAYDGENADPSNGRKMECGVLAYTNDAWSALRTLRQHVSAISGTYPRPTILADCSICLCLRSTFSFDHLPDAFHPTAARKCSPGG